MAADMTVAPANSTGGTPAAAAQPGPFQLSTTYTGELWHTNGGLKTGTDYMQGGDAALSVDAQKLLGLPDARFYVESFYVRGQSLDFHNVGALQAPSALDAYSSMNTLKLYQAFYQQGFNNTDVLVGKYDVQQQFGTTRPMDVFGNRALGLNEVFTASGALFGLNGPSTYPNTALGLRVKQKINDEWSIKIGLLDGEADSPGLRNATDVIIGNKYGALGVGEVDYTPSKYTKIMAGVWGYTGQFNELGKFDADLTPRKVWGDAGGYFGGATRLFTIEGARGVDGFLNVGLTNETTNLLGQSYNGGVTITGPFGTRPSDKLGIAVSLSEVSQAWRGVLASESGKNIAKYETAYELTYRAKITDWLVLQPEVQYIVHPSAAPNAKNALVFGLHFELNQIFHD